VAAIDVGSAAIDRANTASIFYSAVYYTQVEGGNPANSTGTITTVEAYFYAVPENSNVRIGTFAYADGVVTCHDAVTVGAASAGYNKWEGLTLAVSTGEYIGMDAASADGTLLLEMDVSGGTVRWQVVGQQLCVSEASAEVTNTYTSNLLSLYGTGYSTFTESSTLGLGMAASVGRAVTGTRSASLGMGMAVSPIKSWGRERVASCGLGAAVSVSRAVSFARTVTTNLGLAASVTRARAVARSVTAAIGMAVSASKSKGRERTATLGMGFSVSAWRDIIGQILRVFTRHVDPYTVTKAHQDPYTVEPRHVDPYTVVIAPPEDE